MKRAVSLLLALSALPLAARAQAPLASGEPPVVRLTLAEAVSRAREQSPRLAQLRAQGEAAQAAWRGARAGRLPQLELQAGYTRLSEVPELVGILPGAGITTIFPNIPDTWRTRAALTQPIYTGGRINGQVDVAAQQNAAAAADVAAGAADLTLETISAYWTLVTGRESVLALTEGLRAYDQHLTDARNRQAEGLAAANEVLAVQVERDRAELSRLQAQNATEAAAANLRRLLALAPDTVIEPVEPLLAPAPETTPHGELEVQALAARAELQALQARVSAAEAGERVQRAPRRPQASLSAGYEYARPNTRILPLTDEWNDSWSVGVSVSFLVFEGGRTSAATAQARAQAEAARQQLEDARRRVRLEVAQRALDVDTARASLSLAERGRVSARENVRVARDRYREGVSPSSELLDAENALLRAELSLTQAQTGLRQALAGLDRAVGR